MEIRLDALASLAWSQLVQVTAVALMAGLLARLVGRKRPHLAYVLWLLVIVKCVSPPVWSSPIGVFSWVGWPVADAKSHESPTESTTLLSSPEITPLPSFAALPVEALPGSIASEPERLPAMVSAGVSGRPLESGWQTFPLSTVLAVVWLSGTLIYLASVLAKMLWWRPSDVCRSGLA
jgi:hypothetical protein